MAQSCEAVIGGGCLGSRTSQAECPDSAEDTGCPMCEQPGTGWVGGGGGCQTAAGPPPSLFLLLLLFVARTAFAVDVQALQWLDGGPVPGVVDPTAGEPWTTRAAVGAGHAADPVRRQIRDGIHPLVTDLDTVEVAASLQVRDWFRAGVAVPTHRVVVVGTEPDVGVGDIATFLVAPMGPGVAATLSLEIPLRSSPDVARQASGTFGVVGTREDGPFLLAGQARARLQQTLELPGVRWGPRLEGVAGVRTRGWAGLGVEVLMSAPLTLVLSPAPGAWPVEGLGFGTVRVARGIHFDAGAGVGATHGLGTPRWRALAALRLDGTPRDRDGDGIGDLRDLCADRPEDIDSFHDRDGCPEPDNDRDGLVDGLDACPDDAEVYNGFDDDDGCPDELGRWRVVVAPEGDVEQLRILVDDVGSWGLDTRLDAVVRPGPHHLVVEAPGHLPFDAVIDVPPGRSQVDLTLEVLQVGTLLVSLVDADGRSLAGSVHIADQDTVIQPGGSGVPVVSGAVRGSAHSDGYLPETFRALVPPQHTVPLEIELEARPEQAEVAPVLFSLDSAALAAAATDLLDALARWLLDHPDVRLLRIEGHADEVGTPAYNYDLSVRRAEAVRGALVARNIAPERLDAVGTGEARAQLRPEDLPPSFNATVAGTPARDVTFRVLVWDESVALE